MGRVIFQTSMSLDGFMTASEQTPEEPLCKGGEQLHEWGFSSDPLDREYAEHAMGQGGATIAGRVTYEHSLPSWGADGPSGSDRVPVFVVTHEAPAESPTNGVYHFVTDGIESTVERANEAAGERHVKIVGGALWDGSASPPGWSARSRSTSCRCCSGTGTHVRGYGRRSQAARTDRSRRYPLATTSATAS